MNLTPVDKNGNRIEGECTFAQRFTSLPGGANQVVLTFEDGQDGERGTPLRVRQGVVPPDALAERREEQGGKPTANPPAW
jgi:hypothetical protein